MAAAILLRQHANCEAHEYVFRHLLCQSAELIAKAVLLKIDYDKYNPKVLKDKFGHNLSKIVEEALRVALQKALKPTLARELDEISSFYFNQRLRYGGLQDIFRDPNFIQYEAVLKRLCACIRLTNRIRLMERTEH